MLREKLDSVPLQQTCHDICKVLEDILESKMVFQQYLNKSKKMCKNFSGLSSHKFLLCEYLKNSLQDTLQIVSHLKDIIDSQRPATLPKRLLPFCKP